MPRYREISWNGDDKYCTTLEVFSCKIIVGWNNGQIAIYNSVDLHCQTTLNYCRNESCVDCLQCTGTEIIAGYDDGNICVWNFEKEILLLQISARNENDGRDKSYATCMRWRDPKLVIGTSDGRIQISQYVSSSLTLLGGWNTKTYRICDVHFNKSYVILQPSDKSQPVSVHHFNGQKFRSISSPRGICRVALHENYTENTMHCKLALRCNGSGKCLVCIRKR